MYSPGNHSGMLLYLREEGGRLPLAHRCEYITVLVNHILRQADLLKMQAHVDENAFVPEMATLKSLLRTIRFSEHYKALQGRIARNFAAFLLSDDTAAESSRYWLMMRPDEQKHVIRYKYAQLASIQTRQSGVYAPEPAIEWEYVSRQTAGGHFNSAVVYASPDSPKRSYTTIFNFHNDANLTLSALETDTVIAHEGAHYLQSCLARDFLTGALPHGSPLYDDARTIAIIRRTNSLVPGKIRSGYRLSPLEVDAYAFSDMVSELISGDYNGPLRPVDYEDIVESVISERMNAALPPAAAYPPPCAAL